MVLYKIKTDELIGIMIFLVTFFVTATSQAWEEGEEGDSGDEEDRMLEQIKDKPNVEIEIRLLRVSRSRLKLIQPAIFLVHYKINRRGKDYSIDKPLSYEPLWRNAITAKLNSAKIAGDWVDAIKKEHAACNRFSLYLEAQINEQIVIEQVPE